MARLTISCIVRRFCLDCQGNSSQAVRECFDTHCALWEHRLPAHNTRPQGDTIKPGQTDTAPAAPICHEGLMPPANDNIGSPNRTDAHRAAPDETGPDEVQSDKVHTDPKARAAARRRIIRAVRRHCLSCAASRADVRTCAARECGLWSYRFGVTPETYRAVRQRFSRPKTLSLF